MTRNDEKIHCVVAEVLLLSLGAGKTASAYLHCGKTSVRRTMF